MTARLSRSELLNAIRVQAAVATGRSPLTAALLRIHGRALEESGAAPLRDLVLSAFGDRSFAHPWEAPLLLAAALHFAVLGEAPLEERAPLLRLRAFYPSVGGAFLGLPEEEAALGRALQALGRRPPPDWPAFLRGGRLQPGEPGRALGWLAVAQALQGRRRLPLDVVELGCGAGLLLVGDQLTEAGARLGVERRLGLDPAPSDVGDPEVRRALRACVWADLRERLALLDGGIGCLLALRRQGRGPELLAAEPVEALLPALGRLRGAAPGPRRLLLYSAAFSAHLDEDGYDRLRLRVRAALRAWEGPALWLELEPPRAGGEAALYLTAHRLQGDALEALPLGRLPLHPDLQGPIERDAASWLRLTED